MLYDSIYTQIFSLSPEYYIYPAHDYKGETCSTVGEERQYNPRLTKSKTDFVQFMENLNLAYPKKIDTALPWNLNCGIDPDI